MTRRAFTLVEMLLATALAALLLGGLLLMAAALARDSARAAASPMPAPHGAVQLLEWDLTNAATMHPSEDGQSLTLVGQCALDPRTLTPTARFARVVYRVDPQTHLLTREQRFLDDEIRPEPWSELVASDVSRIDVSGENLAAANLTDAHVRGNADANGNVPIPARLSISLARSRGPIVAEVRSR